MMAFCPEHSKWGQNPKFTPISATTSIPTPFLCSVPPPPPRACDGFHCVLVSPFLVSGFLALLHNHCYSDPFKRRSQSCSFLSGCRVLDQSQQKCRFFAEIQIHCEFFQLQPKRETSFSSLGDNEAFCAKRKRGEEKIQLPALLGVVICARVGLVGGVFPVWSIIYR